MATDRQPLLKWQGDGHGHQTRDGADQNVHAGAPEVDAQPPGPAL